MTPILEQCKKRMTEALDAIPDENGNVEISADALVMILSWFESLEYENKALKAIVDSLP